MADISQIKLPNNTTYTVKDTNGRKEAYLTWGGRNYSGSYGPIDATMVGELGANRLAFMPASAVTVEYTRDGGVTWLDYEASDTAKIDLFSGKGTALVIGKADANNKATAHGSDYQLRITINTGTGKVYTVLNKIVILCATMGSSSCTCKIQKALQSTPTEFIDHTSDIAISGWSGYNVLNINGLTTYGNTPSSQYGRVRFLFKANGGNTSYNGLQITRIFGFGGVGWITPSNMAKTGHLYNYDANQSAIFPGAIEPGVGMTVTAGKISGLAAGKSRLYTNGLAISNPTTEKDVGFIRVTGTGESDTVLEIATGDDGGAGEEIVCRQYNVNNVVAREAKLIDKSGNSSFPGTVTATNFDGKINNHTVSSDVPSNADFSDFKVKQVPTTSTSTTEKIPLLLSAYNDQTLSDDSDPALVCASPNLYYNNANQDLYANKINGLPTIPSLEIKFRDVGTDPDNPRLHLFEPYRDDMNLNQINNWQFSHGGYGRCYYYVNVKQGDGGLYNGDIPQGIYICSYWPYSDFNWSQCSASFISLIPQQANNWEIGYEGPYELYHDQFTYSFNTKHAILSQEFLHNNAEHGAKHHRSRYRGRNLGSVITDEQYNDIASGWFTNMYIGDYWEITEPSTVSPENPRTVKFYIADFDPFLGKGSQYNKASNTSKHHIMLIPSRSIPKDPLTLIKPQDCGITVGGTERGGYYNSVFRQNMSTVNTYLYGMFGEDHILKHEECIQNTKYASTYSFDYADAKNCIYADCTAELLSQNNVFGHRLVENGGNGLRFYLNDGFLERQVPIFRHLGLDEIIEDTYINSDTGTTRTCLRDNVQNYWVTYYFTKGFAQIQNSASSLFHPYFLLCKSNT